MKTEVVNRIFVLIASFLLILFLISKNVQEDIFTNLELLFSIAILFYDILSQIYFLLI